MIIRAILPLVLSFITNPANIEMMAGQIAKTSDKIDEKSVEAGLGIAVAAVGVGRAIVEEAPDMDTEEGAAAFVEILVEGLDEGLDDVLPMLTEAERDEAMHAFGVLVLNASRIAIRLEKAEEAGEDVPSHRRVRHQLIDQFQDKAREAIRARRRATKG